MLWLDGDREVCAAPADDDLGKIDAEARGDTLGRVNLDLVDKYRLRQHARRVVAHLGEGRAARGAARGSPDLVGNQDRRRLRQQLAKNSPT